MYVYTYIYIYIHRRRLLSCPSYLGAGFGLSKYRLNPSNPEQTPTEQSAQQGKILKD